MCDTKPVPRSYGLILEDQISVNSHCRASIAPDANGKIKPSKEPSSGRLRTSSLLNQFLEQCGCRFGLLGIAAQTLPYDEVCTTGACRYDQSL